MEPDAKKVVIVTGGGTGIGQSTVVEFAKKGYNVVITGRTKSTLETTANLCKEEGLGDFNILMVVSDVTKPEDNARIIEETAAKFNRIDVLVNNAGHFDVTPFADCTLDTLDGLYNVHFRGMFDLTQKVMPHLLKTKGNIINVSSIAGLRPLYTAIALTSMKAAQDQFTRAISVEYAPKGVRVNSVNPGIVKTEIWERTTGSAEKGKELCESLVNCEPIAKLMDPRDVAMLILFLASDDASFITGANVPVEGGWRNTMTLPK